VAGGAHRVDHAESGGRRHELTDQAQLTAQPAVGLRLAPFRQAPVALVSAPARGHPVQAVALSVTDRVHQQLLGRARRRRLALQQRGQGLRQAADQVAGVGLQLVDLPDSGAVETQDPAGLVADQGVDRHIPVEQYPCDPGAVVGQLARGRR
jgi:hypothetical protein